MVFDTTQKKPWLCHKKRVDHAAGCACIKFLDDEGHNVTFFGGAWKITKGFLVVACGNKTRSHYMISNCRGMIVVANSCAKSNL